MDPFPVAAENVSRIDLPEPAGWGDSKQRMVSKSLTANAQRGDRPERIGADEDPRAGPPKGDLPPEPVVAHG